VLHVEGACSLISFVNAEWLLLYKGSFTFPQHGCKRLVLNYVKYVLVRSWPALTTSQQKIFIESMVVTQVIKSSLVSWNPKIHYDHYLTFSKFIPHFTPYIPIIHFNIIYQYIYFDMPIVCGNLINTVLREFALLLSSGDGLSSYRQIFINFCC
jgi:hypothetical protein